MSRRDAFSSCHPLVAFLYFALVLTFTMCFMDPASLAASLCSAAACLLSVKGRKALKLQLRALLPILLATTLINPLFNHRGATVLAYFPWGSPLTLESLLYGLAAAAMLCAVINWFAYYTAVMPSDKFIYLFGRVIPSLSLVLSMALRFVPRFQAQFKAVAGAQRCLGRDVSSGPLLQRLQNAVAVFSIMVTWSLENALGAADSMKSRGYGLPGRTAFSIYRFDRRDKALLAWLAFCGVLTAAGWLSGGFSWRYFPTLSTAAPLPLAACLRLVYLTLCLTPLLLNGKEALTWKRLTSAA